MAGQTSTYVTLLLSFFISFFVQIHISISEATNIPLLVFSCAFLLLLFPRVLSMSGDILDISHRMEQPGRTRYSHNHIMIWALK